MHALDGLSVVPSISLLMHALDGLSVVPSICLLMHALDGTATWVVHVLEGGIPFEGNGCGAGYAGLLVDTTGSGVAGEVLGKDTPKYIFDLLHYCPKKFFHKVS